MDSKKVYRYGCAQGSISIAVMNASGKIGMECVIETKASMILQFFDGLREICRSRLKKEPRPPGCTAC
jgi:hypothetical protein